MSAWRRWLGLGRRGTASVEFAIAIPAVLILVGWFYDLSNLLVARIALSNAVDNAAAYALLSGSGTPTSTLQGIVTGTSWLTGATSTATGPACYCPTGSPITGLTSATCGSTCSNGTSAGTYFVITGNYTYVPMLPGLSSMANTALSESASVRVQ